MNLVNLVSSDQHGPSHVPKLHHDQIGGRLPDGAFALMNDHKVQLLAALDRAEEYRVLAIRSQDRGERECYERIIEHYVKIAEELEVLIDG
jgi:hypothetical protein